MNTYPNSFCIPNEALEIVIIEDNKLINMLLSKTFDSTINRILNLKNFSINFSSFKNGADFYDYLESKDFSGSKFIVFSDYYLEEMKYGLEILEIISRESMDVTVIALTESAAIEKSINSNINSAINFVPENNKTTVIAS